MDVYNSFLCLAVAVNIFSLTCFHYCCCCCYPKVSLFLRMSALLINQWRTLWAPRALLIICRASAKRRSQERWQRLPCRTRSGCCGRRRSRSSTSSLTTKFVISENVLTCVKFSIQKRFSFLQKFINKYRRILLLCCEIYVVECTAEEKISISGVSNVNEFICFFVAHGVVCYSCKFYSWGPYIRFL